MGQYNATCMLSGLSIWDQPIGLLFLIKRTKFKYNSSLYVSDEFQQLNHPIFCEYNGYGSISEVEDTKYADFILQQINELIPSKTKFKSIKDVVDKIANGEEPIKLSNGDLLYHNFVDKEVWLEFVKLYETSNVSSSYKKIIAKDKKLLKTISDFYIKKHGPHTVLIKSRSEDEREHLIYHTCFMSGMATAQSLVPKSISLLYKSDLTNKYIKEELKDILSAVVNSDLINNIKVSIVMQELKIPFGISTGVGQNDNNKNIKKSFYSAMLQVLNNRPEDEY